MMNKIFADSEEKFVKTTVIYADTNNKLHANRNVGANSAITFSGALSADEVKDLFFKGVTIYCSGIYYKPVSFEEPDADESIEYAKIMSSVPGTITVDSQTKNVDFTKVFYSKEYTVNAG